MSRKVAIAKQERHNIIRDSRNFQRGYYWKDKNKKNIYDLFSDYSEITNNSSVLLNLMKNLFLSDKNEDNINIRNSKIENNAFHVYTLTQLPGWKNRLTKQ